MTTSIPNDVSGQRAQGMPAGLGASSWEELWGSDSPQRSYEAAAASREPTRKDRIFVSRDYRYFSKPSSGLTILGLILIAAWAAIWIVFYDPLTQAICDWVAKVASQVVDAPASVRGASYVPGMGDLHYVSMEGSLPSFTMLIVIVVMCLIVIIFVAQAVHSALPIGIYVSMGAFLLLLSALFFLFWPDSFPYDLTDYSHLYMEQQVVMWIFVPLVGGLAVFMVDKRPVAALVSFLCLLCVNLVFGIVRYSVYLMLLCAFSSVFMVVLFFILGVLFDFMQMVAVYVIYMRHVSIYMSRMDHRGEWLW